MLNMNKFFKYMQADPTKYQSNKFRGSLQGWEGHTHIHTHTDPHYKSSSDPSESLLCKTAQAFGKKNTQQSKPGPVPTSLAEVLCFHLIVSGSLQLTRCSLLPGDKLKIVKIKHFMKHCIHFMKENMFTCYLSCSAVEHVFMQYRLCDILNIIIFCIDN